MTHLKSNKLRQANLSSSNTVMNIVHVHFILDISQQFIDGVGNSPFPLNL